jgi:hypothetical protein
VADALILEIRGVETLGELERPPYSFSRMHNHFCARGAVESRLEDGEMMNDSEQSLVRSAQSGDRAAFEELVRRTARLVFARLYLETVDLHRAEDLLQETLLIAFRALSKLSEPKAFRTWLLKIAPNVLTDPLCRERPNQKCAGPHGLDRS